MNLYIEPLQLHLLKNLIFLDTSYIIDLLAFTLMSQYGLKSLFDAYDAATALNMVEDHTIINRVDPRILLK